MNYQPLSKFIVSAQAGIACGKRDEKGTAQLRLNNLLTNGAIDFSEHIRIPSDVVSEGMLLEAGDVLFNNTNSVELVGKTAYFSGHNEKITFSNHITRLRVRSDELDPEYLAFWLQHQWRSKVFAGMCDRWIGQAAVQRSKLEALKIPISHIHQQRMISVRLKAQVAEVETARQAARAQLRDADLLRRRVLQSTFDELANEPTTLGEVLTEIQTGKSFQTAEVLARPDELGVLKVSAVSWSQFRADEAKALKGDYTPAESHRVKQGDLLISRANTKELVGAVVLVERDYPMRLLSDKTLRLIVDESRASKDYLLFALRSKMAREHIELYATGTSSSMRNISQEVIASTPIVLPTLDEQRKIATSLKTELAEVNTLRDGLDLQQRELDALPQRLLTQAFEM